jgi:multifunctional methyltransferase subunit TRM112
MMGRIDYPALKQGAEQMGVQGLPDTWQEQFWDDPEMVQKLHHALLEVHLEQGNLVCPETGRRFPVQQGVPNMLLHEDEV